jgi:hypothetical protein
LFYTSQKIIKEGYFAFLIKTQIYELKKIDNDYFGEE